MHIMYTVHDSLGWLHTVTPSSYEGLYQRGEDTAASWCQREPAYQSSEIIIINNYYASVISALKFFLIIVQKEYDDTPLMVACMKGHINTAKVLVDHGAIVDGSNSVKFLSL